VGYRLRVMRFSLSVLAAILAAAVSPALAGQAPPAKETHTPTASAVDPSRLPVNVGRIGRQLRQVQMREERDGLKLRYSIDVFGALPKITFITPLDNIVTGDVPRSAPTHTDMIRMMTPKEFSSPVIGITLPRKK
jgi:hypothetical protein